MDPRVIADMETAFRSVFGSAESRHHVFGNASGNAVDRSRSSIERLCGAKSGTIILTASATESNNLAILGSVGTSKDGSHIVSTASEHLSVLLPLRSLNARIESTILSVDSRGEITVDQVEAAIGPKTVLVSVIFVNNEVGTINPIADIGAVCRKRGILFHTDATQAVGKLPINLLELPIDLMSFSAHKIYGPKGVGALYVNRETVGTRLKPIMYGGGQENGLRPGTLPVPLVSGFGTACDLAREAMDDDANRIGAMRDRLWERFQNEIPNIVLNGNPTNRLYNNLNVSFLGIPSEAFMTKLRGIIAVSAGSACTSSNPEPSHVLMAMGIHSDRIESAIRFGIGRFNTMAEIEFIADQIRDTVLELRLHFR